MTGRKRDAPKARRRLDQVDTFYFIGTAIADVLAIGLGLAAAVFLREWVRDSGFTRGPQADFMYRHLQASMAYYAAAGYILFRYVDVYRGARFLSGNREEIRIFKALFAFTLFNFILGFLLPDQLLFSRLTLGIACVFCSGFVFLERRLIRSLRRRLWRQGMGVRRALVVGTGPVTQFLADELARTDRYGYRLVGMLSRDRSLQRTGRARMLGGMDRFERVVQKLQVDDIFLCEPTWSVGQIMEIFCLEHPNRVRLHLASHAFDTVFQQLRMPVDTIDTVPLLDFGAGMSSPIRRRLKRIKDLVGAFIGLIITSPFFAAIALLIKLEDRGPVFFAQERCGEDGKRFSCYKFRSMQVGAEEMRTDLEDLNEVGSVMFKMRNDPRITRMGRFLRKYSLDELPQLVNILKGEMSLVGPRPPLVSEMEQYADWHRLRLAGPMGLSGLWQVSGRNALEFDDATLMDFYYLRNHSFFLDYRILVRTIFTVLGGQGW
ncbi:MAG: sugar transferase [Planctomycetota bacterium]|jgi:exopolysaccharide biosynthesis polyprenyl glycosylphosphotransferase